MSLGGRPRKQFVARDFSDVATREMLAPLVRAKGISRVAQMVGLSQPTVSIWLSGAKEMELDTRLKVAQAVGMVVTIRVAPKRVNRRRAI